MKTQDLATRALSVMRAVRLIGAASPLDGEAELERLASAFSAGRPRLPRWTYGGADLAAARAELDRLAAACRDDLYSARIDELRLEAETAAAVGRPELGALAARRFHRPSRAADLLAASWTSDARDADEPIPTDASDPRSLLSRVREAIGAHRAPFAVRVVSSLGAFAATGERTVYVAAGRALGERASRRVALHEVLGHVLPRVRAAGLPPIFALGTARGTDDQEGLALAYEERGGFLDAPRRAELARRHRAASSMRAGADFVEVVRELRAGGALVRDAVSIAARVFRGSDGTFPGLGRESVYLTSFVRVRARLRADPDAERVLASGQVALDALDALRAQFGGRHASADPPPTFATL